MIAHGRQLDDRLVAVLSETCWRFTVAEAAGFHRRLMAISVDPCEPPEILVGFAGEVWMPWLRAYGPL